MAGSSANSAPGGATLDRLRRERLRGSFLAESEFVAWIQEQKTGTAFCGFSGSEEEMEFFIAFTEGTRLLLLGTAMSNEQQ